MKFRITCLALAAAVASCGDSDTNISDVDSMTGDGADATIACSAAPIDVTLAIDGMTVQPGGGALDFEATVVSVDDHALVVVSDGKTVTLSYDLGGYTPPVQSADVITVMWREVQTFGFARGLALRRNGRLLALIDDGRFGSGWGVPGVAGTLPDGFKVVSRPVGCPIERDSCGTHERVGLRFSHPSGVEVLAMPGADALLTTGEGERFRVVNALAERILDVNCTNPAERMAWFILAAEP